MKKCLVASVLLLLGCGGGSSSPAAPSAPTVSSAKLTSAGVGVFTVTSSQRVVNSTLTCGNIHVEWLFTESAGLGARLTRTDVWVQEADGDITNRRVDTAPTLVVAANTQQRAVTDRFECGYEGEDLPFVVRAEWVFTDERGNQHALSNAIGLERR